MENHNEFFLALEEKRATAMIERDIATLQGLLCNDLIYIHSSARIDTKETLIKAIERGDAVYDALDSTDQQVKIYDSAVIVSGVAHVRGKSHAREVDVRVRVTNVYVKGPHGWALSTSQSTAIPA